MFSTLNSGSSCPSLSPKWGYCVVMFFNKTLGGNPVIDQHLIQGGNRNTPNSFMLQKPGQALACWATWLIWRLDLPTKTMLTNENLYSFSNLVLCLVLTLYSLIFQGDVIYFVCLSLTFFQDEVEEEIEEDDSYLDLAGMKQQSQMNVMNSLAPLLRQLKSIFGCWLLKDKGFGQLSDTKLLFLLA